jgi:hypothetical protein
MHRWETLPQQRDDPSPSKSNSCGHSLMDPPSGYIKPDVQDLQLTNITAKEMQVIAEANMSQVKYAFASSWGSEDYPSLYDRHTRHMMSAHMQDALLLANLIPDSSIPSNKKLLDTACGTNALTFEATQLGIPDVNSNDFARGMSLKLLRQFFFKPSLMTDRIFRNSKTPPLMLSVPLLLSFFLKIESTVSSPLLESSNQAAPSSPLAGCLKKASWDTTAKFSVAPDYLFHQLSTYQRMPPFRLKASWMKSNQLPCSKMSMSIGSPTSECS